MKIVRLHIEEYGADAARYLEELALATPDKFDRMNYARAASALATADPAALRRMQTASLRARYGVPKGSSTDRSTPRRRRR